jgi:peptide/nickel transport system permease protein
MTDVVIEATPQSDPRPQHLLRRIVGNPLGLLSLIWLLLIVVVAALGSYLAPYSATSLDLEHVASGPSWSHLLGTDALGRDVLSRLIIGTRPSIVGVLIGVAVFTAVGLPLGLLAGYFGRAVDSIVSRIGDVLMSLPFFILILVVLSVFGNNVNLAMVAMGVLGSAGLMRVARTIARWVRTELYVDAARVFGLRDLKIIVRHVLPRMRSAVIVQIAFWSQIALLILTGLAFLGFGPQPPNPSWGGSIADAASVIVTQPFQIVPPGIVVTITVLALGLLGNSVRDAVSEPWSHSQAGLLRQPKSRRATDASGVHETADPASTPLLRVRGLSVSKVADGRVPLVRSVDLDIDRGETIGVVGESGCGKTLTSLGLIGALPPGVEQTDGVVQLDGRNLALMSASERHGVRGKRIAYVSQDPLTSLDPMYTVGNQLREAVRRHQGGGRGQTRARAIELLAMVRLAEPEVVARKYPHQLSGGMAQRVSIAIALAGEPELLVADEPTTALDVTTQAEILALLAELKAKTGMATLLITHDWGVVATICDRAVVMYAGQVVENGRVAELFKSPRHPYTAALLRSNPHVALELGLDESPAVGDPIRLLPTIQGEVPRPGSWDRSCAFAARCSFATPECVADWVPLRVIAGDHQSRCIHSEQLSNEARVAS